ncbi:MAG: hypothetical protein ACK4KT_06830 [Thermaurantimonas sp.]
MEKIWFSALFFTVSFPILAQFEEVKQMADAYYQSQSDKYDRKLYNLASRDHGKIKESDPVHMFEMQLIRKDKNPETGRKTKAYLTIYGYQDAEECRAATDFWFKRFIGNGSIRPNRKSKIQYTESYYYIMVNQTYLLIVDIPCMDWEIEEWNMLKKSLLHIFEEKNSKAIEIDCKGQVLWSLNSY